MEESLDCTECQKTFKNKKSLQTHILKIHNKKNHVCVGCNVNLSSNSSLLRHQKSCNSFIKKEVETEKNTKQAELEITVKFLQEKLIDKDLQIQEKDLQLQEKELLIQEKDKLLISHIDKFQTKYEQLEQSRTSMVKDMYKETIDTKNKLFEVSNRANPIQYVSTSE